MEYRLQVVARNTRVMRSLDFNSNENQHIDQQNQR